jgi:hypothetical protein
MPPGLAHALLALVVQTAVAVPIAFALRIEAVAAWAAGGVLALVIGAAVAIGIYLGRERRQSEEWAGSNRIPPWVWRPRALRDLAWPALAVLAVVALVGGGRAAWGHQAPSGWAYDRECCHDLDCAPVRDGLIREVPGGYRVQMRAGDHPMLRGAAQADVTIPHGDARIRTSGDSDRHACVGPAGHVFCIYVPPGGV